MLLQLWLNHVVLCRQLPLLLVSVHFQSLAGKIHLGVLLGLVRWVCRISFGRSKHRPVLTVIGYPMAKNLRARIPTSDLLTVYDVNSSATKQFAQEVGVAASSTDAPAKGTGIHIAQGPREVVEKSVSRF